MTDEPSHTPKRFTRVARPREGAIPADYSRVKFRDSLDAITTLLHHASIGGRDSFVRDSPAYASGSMVVIRIAALFETAEFSAYLDATPEEARGGIVTMRNIASHAGYRPMDDDVFWSTLTTLIPSLLAEWRRTAAD